MVLLKFILWLFWSSKNLRRRKRQKQVIHLFLLLQSKARNGYYHLSSFFTFSRVVCSCASSEALASWKSAIQASTYLTSTKIFGTTITDCCLKANRYIPPIFFATIQLIEQSKTTEPSIFSNKPQIPKLKESSVFLPKRLQSIHWENNSTKVAGLCFSIF